LVLLALAIGCGDPAGTGGSGDDGDALANGSAYGVSCAIDTLVLNIPIELSYELDRRYVAGGSAELMFSVTVTFTEQASTALIDAGIDKVDMISLEIGASIEGAAPINHFDLQFDPDDNGIAGPHYLDLDGATVTTTVAEGVDSVEFGLGLNQVSLLLGDFQVLTDCLGPTLTGSSARSVVEPSG